jgi:TatD DNase family protein
MIDTHAHLYDEHFLLDLATHVEEIQSAGVSEVWLPNCDLATWNDLKLVIDQFPDFALPMIGLHPTYVKANFREELASLAAILANQKVLAIGEIGLDYHWDTTFKTEQQIAFEQQCHWALDNQVWIDVHCRKAYADLIKMLKKSEYANLIGIIHCFSGDAREASVLVDLGYKLGIGGVITYKNTTLFEDIKHISLNHLVLETDSPYLTPIPFRGQPNSPKNIPLIAQKLADLYQVPVEEVMAKTSETARSLKVHSGF